MITADTITDEEINRVWGILTATESAGAAVYGVRECIIALGLPDVKPTGNERVGARAFVADLINAGRVPGFATCQRCGASIPRSWDHLDVGEFGERYRCAELLNARAEGK